MAVQDIKVVSQFTIKGNDDATNTIASIAEVKVRRILRNNLAGFSFRNVKAVENIISIGNLGTAIYRLPKRVSFGTDYDFNDGISAQRTGAQEFQIHIDQHLTINVPMEGFDLSRFKASDPAVQSTMMNEWINSAMDSYLLTLEGVFLRGVRDYYIAKYDTNPEGVLVLDPKTMETPDGAQAAYYTIKAAINKMLKKVTSTQIGTNLSGISGAVSMEFYTNLTRSHIKYSGVAEALQTLVSGELVKDSVLGINILQHFMLENKFEKGTDSQINKDITFDFTDFLGVFLHDANVAHAIGMEQTEYIKNPNTLNIDFKSKNLGSVPTISKHELGVIVLPKAPTAEQIAAAKAMAYDGKSNRYEKSFKLAEYDSLGAAKKN